MFKVIKLRKIIICVVLFFMFFAIIYYKNVFCGNNIIKNRVDKNVETVLESLKFYKADCDVKITSNKSDKNYKIHQEVDKNYELQELLTDDLSEQMKIEYFENNLKISNTGLKLEKIYENYENLLNNSLFLNTFEKEYNTDENIVKAYENDNQIILEIELKNNKNTYIKYKKLYINKSTLLPEKLEIKASTNKEKICIIYNSIEINK